MRLPEPRRRTTGDEVLPLINIIFLLLIFFMLAGQMNTPERFPVTPPEAEEGQAAREEATLLVAADGRLAWQGEAVPLAALAARAAAHEGERLMVRADGDVTSATLMPILARLREAGIQRVTLITRRDS